MEDKYRVCKVCTPHHIENCGTCFGWGVKQDRYDGTTPIPVTAGETMRVVHANVQLSPCPECGSTIKGVPKCF